MDERFRRDDGRRAEELVTGMRVRAYSPEIFSRQNWHDLVSETELGQLGNQLCSHHESLGRNQKQCTNEVILNLRTLFRVLHGGTEGNFLRWPSTSFFPNHLSVSILLQTPKWSLQLLSTPIVVTFTLLHFTIHCLQCEGWRDDINLYQLKSYLFRKKINSNKTKQKVREYATSSLEHFNFPVK